VIDPEALARRAAEVCRCGHERAFHNSCSKCWCSFFLPQSERDKALIKAWTAERKARQTQEAE